MSLQKLSFYKEGDRLKRLKRSPHSRPQTKVANGKAGINPPQNPPVSFCCVLDTADHHTVAGGDLTPSHPLLCPSGEFTLGFAMVHFLYQCGLAMVPQNSLDIAMKILFF